MCLFGSVYVSKGIISPSQPSDCIFSAVYIRVFKFYISVLFYNLFIHDILKKLFLTFTPVLFLYVSCVIVDKKEKKCLY